MPEELSYGVLTVFLFSYPLPNCSSEITNPPFGCSKVLFEALIFDRAILSILIFLITLFSHKKKLPLRQHDLNLIKLNHSFHKSSLLFLFK